MRSFQIHRYAWTKHWTFLLPFANYPQVKWYLPLKVQQGFPDTLLVSTKACRDV
jgi:hypothetical protein